MSYYTEATKETEKYKKKLEEEGAKEKKEINRQLDESIAKAEGEFETKKSSIEQDYRDIVDTNAIQKELDKRQIAETMSNLGLTRSGLNATQQTAVELSSGNRNAAARLQRQSAIDSLTKSLAEYKIGIEDKRRTSMNQIDQSIAENVAQYSKDLTEAAMDATQKDNKATIEANFELAKLAAEQQEKYLEDQKKFSNKAYMLKSLAKENGVRFLYYDHDTNKVVSISEEDLKEQFINEGKTEDQANNLIGGLLKGFKQLPNTSGKIANYTTAINLNKTTNDYGTVLIDTMLNVSEGNKSSAMDKIYNALYVDTIITPEEAEDIMGRAGISWEEMVKQHPDLE